MSGQHLRLEIDQGLASITVDRPEVRNAMSREMALQLTDYLHQIEEDSAIRCVVFRGAGGNFISGGDISAFARSINQSPEARSQEFFERVASIDVKMSLLTILSKPVIVVVEGSVAGAGLSYALAADYVLTASDARFVFAHIHLGLPMDCGLSYYLPRVVGWGRARRLAMTGATINAAEAFDIGIASELVEPEGIDRRLAQLIEQFSGLPTQALAGMKRQLDASWRNDMNAQVALEAQLVAGCVAQDEFVNRVSRFIRRKPLTEDQ